MKQFENDIYIMRIHKDGFMEFIAKNDVVLDVTHLWESKKLSEEYMPGTQFYLLLEGEEFFQVTKEAREIAAGPQFSSHLKAVALYAKNLPLKLLGNIYIKINKPVVQTRFFDNRERAEEWLRSLML